MSGDRPIAHLGTPVVDLRLRTLDAVEGVFELLDGAVQLFKGDPGFPDRFGPVEVLHRDVTEDLPRVVVHILPAAAVGLSVSIRSEHM